MKLSDNYGNNLTKKFLLKLISIIFGYTIFLIIGWFISRYICKLFIWYEDDLLYTILINIGYNIFSITLIWLSGCVVIFYIILRQTLGYIDSIVEASELLITTNDEWIKLPKNLSEVENRMNSIKQQSIKNIKIAKESEQKKNDLIVYLAHDLKTPLTSIIGYLELLKESPNLPIKQRIKYTNLTLDKAYRLEELMNEFFEIAKFNDTNVVLMKKNLKLKLMFDQLIDEFYPLINEQNKKIIVTCDSQVTCFADPDKLSRVFDNIIKNAIFYSFENTDILINVTCTDNIVSILIQNEGYTIPENKLNSIFEKFYRLDDSRNSKNGGAGLGLAIAKEIILLHNGNISAKSINNITTFTLTLPK